MLQQWIDLARSTGIQTQNIESPSYTLDSHNLAALECKTEETNVDEVKNQ